MALDEADIIPTELKVFPSILLTLEAYKSGKFASFSLSPFCKNCSLRRKRNVLWLLTPVSNICKSAPKGSQRNQQKRQWLFFQANHSAYSNPGTQERAQNKDYSAVSQTDLTRV